MKEVQRGVPLSFANISSALVLLYAKQENEEIFHPLHLVPPSLVGLALAVSLHSISIDI